MCSFTVSPLFFQVTSFISLGLEKIIKFNWLWWENLYLIEQLTTLRKTLRPYLYSQDLMFPESDDVNSLCSQGPIPWRSHVPCVLCSQGLTVCSKELFLPRSFVSCVPVVRCFKSLMFQGSCGPIFSKSSVSMVRCSQGLTLCSKELFFPRSYFPSSILYEQTFPPDCL